MKKGGLSSSAANAVKLDPAFIKQIQELMETANEKRHPTD